VTAAPHPQQSVPRSRECMRKFSEVERTSVTVRQKRPVDYYQRALPITNPI